MKDAFDKSATPAPSIEIPRRWPEWEQPSGRYTGAMGPDKKPEHIDPAAIECAAFARADDKVAGYRAVFIIAEGVEPFVTFLKPAEEKVLRDALAPRGLLAVDAENGPVQPGFLNSFEHPETVLMDTSRITRIFDGLKQRGDYVLFDVVFGKSQSLSFCVRDAEFDSEAVIEASDIIPKYKETPQEKWFREADEGTLISRAMDRRRDRHRAILNDFARDLAAKAPQLYQIENTRALFYTRPSDVEEIFVFTQQTDAARITFNAANGEKYGMPFMETVYFESPEGAVDGAEKLRRKMAETVSQRSPKAKAPCR